MVTDERAIPDLTTVPFGTNAFTQEGFSWRVPNAFTDVVYLRFQGCLRTHLDVFNLKWRIDEFTDLVPCHALVVDLCELELDHKLIDIGPIRSRVLRGFLRLIVRVGQNHGLFLNAAPGEVTEDPNAACREMLEYVNQFRAAERLGPITVSAFLDEIQPISLYVSLVTSEFFSWIGKHSSVGGYIKFAGEYRRGSAGKPDGLFIGWRINQCCELLNPNTLVIDFRALNYEWGEDLYAQPIPGYEGPVRVVISPERFEAFRGLLGEQVLRTDLADAFRELQV